MATFVLVHGAWLGGWCWKRIRKRLHGAGHDVFTPTLTGLGERSQILTRDVNLETHILDVVNLIQCEELSNIVLCGHSYGGAVISGVADRIPDRIGSLVYLDAYVLHNGENVAQHVPAIRWQNFIEGAKSVGDGWKIPPIPPEVFNVKDAADAEWMRRQCTMQPIGCFEQAVKLTGKIDQIKNVTFILMTGYAQHSPFSPFRDKAKAKGWRTLTMTCGHMVMFDQPEELSRILLQHSEAQPAELTITA
jgi:pimeloyl-ACP methyl ester carboxylesterase